MSFNFPASPTANLVYTDSNTGIIYQWNDTYGVWRIVANGSTIIEPVYNYTNTKVSSVTSNSTSRIWANTVITDANSKLVFLDLATSGVTASNYGSANTIPVISVDSYGRVTNASVVSVQGMDYGYANSVAVAANSYSLTVGAASNGWTNTMSTADRSVANGYANSVGTAGNNYTNALGTAGNNYTITVGAASNGWTNTMSTADRSVANGYANSVGTAGNNYSIAVGAASNGWANTVGTAGNNYTNAVGVSSNGYANAVGTAGNNYTIIIGAASNGWTNTMSTADRSIANGYANTVGTAGNNYTNAVGLAGNNYTNALGVAGNNYSIAVGAASNGWANTVGTAGNNYSIAVGAASNGWSNAVGTAGNNYTNALTTAGNNYANAVGTAGNNYTNAVGTAGNNYTRAVGAASNGWANTVGTAGNNYSIAVGAASNTYSNGTFLKLTGGSINGDLVITGNLVFTGNAVTISSNTLSIGDSLIYLAANNYSGTDTVPIGFIANYGNTTAANVHTGLARNPTNKQYYLFNGYDLEPGTNNQINFGSNNMTNAVLVADIITNNLTLGGANAILTINSTAAASNGWANAVGTSSNNYTLAVGAASNGWANTVGTAGNNYTNAVGTAGNNYTNALTTAGNNYINAVGTSSNNYTVAVGAASNGRANTVGTAGNNYTNAVGTAGNNYTNAVVVAGNNYTIAIGISSNGYANTVGTAGNNYTNAVGTSGNNYTNVVGAAGNNYMLFITAGINSNAVNTSIGANSYSNTVGTAGNNYTNAVGVAGNNYTNALTTAGNNYTITVGAASNGWSNTVGNSGNNYANSVGTAGNNYTISIGAAANNWSNTKLANTSGISFAGNLYFPSGNVGIGNTTPSAKFQVTDTTGAASTVVAKFDGASSRFVRIIDNDGSGGMGVQTTRIYGDSGASGTLKLFNTYGNSNRSEITIDTYIALNTSSASVSTERLRIDASGNVGIGYTNPLYGLMVAGDGYFNNGITTGRGLTQTSTGTLSLGGAATQFIMDGSSYSRVVYQISGATKFFGGTTTSTGPFIISTDGGSSGFNVTQNNTIGIGTGSPTSNLHVIGTANVTSTIYTRDVIAPFYTLYNEGAGAYIGVSGNYLRFGGTTEFMRIANTSGFVGIGTASALSRLHVKGAVNGSEDLLILEGAQTGTGVTGILFKNAGGPANSAAIRVGPTAEDPSGGRSLTFYGSNGTALVERVRIDSTGNVGIGTASPTYKLHVVGNTYITGLISAGGLTLANSEIDTFTVVAASTTDQIIDSFANTAWRSAHYNITMTSGTDYHTTQISLIHDGTNAYITEYGTISTANNLGAFSAVVTSGTVRLNVVPTFATTTINMLRTTNK